MAVPIHDESTAAVAAAAKKEPSATTAGHPAGAVEDEIDWDVAASVYVTSLSGEKRSIRDICGDQRTLLVFMRRFECATCTSYFILFAHLRPVLQRSNVRTIFITCHENLSEVQSFLNSFAFWLRSLHPAGGGGGDAHPRQAGILPGEIYLDVKRASYAFFGLHNNINKLQVIGHFVRSMTLKMFGKSHIGKAKSAPIKYKKGPAVIKDVRFFLWNELEAVLPQNPSKSSASFQVPGIFVVERGKIHYKNIVVRCGVDERFHRMSKINKCFGFMNIPVSRLNNNNNNNHKHVVLEQSRAIPERVNALSAALSCPIESLDRMDDVVQKGLERFMEVVGARDKTAALQSDELVFKNRLGGGVESDVFRCDWRDLPVAVKCYKIPAAEDAAPSHQANPFASFTIEAAMLMSLRHKNVIHLLGFGCDPPSRPFLVNELLARGSLFHVLAAAPASDLAPARKKSILLDAAAGMSFLHACRPTVVHLDLKSLNLLIADDWTCKVADFGIAATVAGQRRRVLDILAGRGGGGGGGGGAGGAGDSWGGADGNSGGGGGGESTGTAGGGGAAHGGTIHWMPPELMIDDVPPASTKVDVFAFAVIMWEVAWRKKPWLGVDLGVICSEVLAGRRLEVGRSWPPEFARLVRDCWDQDPKRRPEFKECLRRLQRIEVP